jgi:hypothetical protein
MHSSGRGEESPDAYRGVVLPSQQDQAPLSYGEHVQPAAGTPWGSPQPQGEQPQAPGLPGAPQAPGLPQYPGYPGHPGSPGQPQIISGQLENGPAGALPEAADATQMLPPYPGDAPGPAATGPAPVADATQMLPPYPGNAPASGCPGAPASAPVADATQMLPPYPGADPHRAPQQAAAPGPVPPMPQAPPPQPAQPPQGPAGHGAAPEPAPAEATQALPLSIFQEQDAYGQPQDGYGQQAPQPPQSQPQQPTYEQAYGGQGQEYASYDGYEQRTQQFQQPGQPPQHDSDYDHLFRQDVPSPAPMRPHIIQPDRPPGQQQGQPPYGGHPGGYGPDGRGQGGYDGYAGHDDGYTGDRGSGGRKLSPKVLIGIVVAGCVVAGLVVGGLLNSGGSASADNAGGTSSTSPSAAASASASGSDAPAAADPAKQQAQSLDALLKTSGNSRSSVVGAVASTKECKDLGAAASDLRAAQAQRTGLVTQLGSLQVDKLQDHAALTDALTKAWQASAAADGHYANWAHQAATNKSVCKGGHARTTKEAEEGNRQSGTATEQKKRAVKLWNAIAEKYGLTTRTYSQL